MKKVKHKISVKRAVFTSFGVDILDIFLNFSAAILTGSMVMIAETLQGFSDLITDSFLFLGLKAQKHRSEKYSFGKGKAVYFFVFLATLVMVFLTAGATIYFGVKRFLLPELIENLFLAYVVLLISIFSNLYSFSVSFRRIIFKRKPRKIFKVFKESDLVITKTTFVGDLVGILAAVFGLVALILYRLTGDWRFDGLGAILIGIILLVLSVILLKNVKNFLIGKRASRKIISEIKKATLEISEVRKVLGIKTMYIGLEKILVNLDVHLEDDLNTDRIEKVISRIKKNIRKKVPKIENIQVELEAPKKKISKK